MILHSKFQSKLEARIPDHEFYGRVSSTTHRKLGKLFRQPVSNKLPLMAKPDGLLWAPADLLLLTFAGLSSSLTLSFQVTSFLPKCFSLPRRYIDWNEQINMLIIYLGRLMLCHFRSLLNLLQTLDSPIHLQLESEKLDAHWAQILISNLYWLTLGICSVFHLQLAHYCALSSGTKISSHSSLHSSHLHWQNL